ncbi:MAG: UDP-3-O-acyl-N-acetylglucosamine deacetylase [Rhodobacteraceae bacterium]|nr:UDP-3-O-acyl-N-acetylglucosamine deacetylase [Paracoccaceae bacterium]
MAQATLAKPVSVNGRGLHTGVHSNLVILPAAPDTGIVFERADAPASGRGIAADFRNVSSTRLCTTLTNREGDSVQTVEHLLASLTACGIANAIVHIDGPEVPGVDGSALPFAREILGVGVKWQEPPRKVLRILRDVWVEGSADSSVFAGLVPSERFEMDLTIEFPDPVGRQNKSLCLANGAIASVLGSSRTFCAISDIKWMQSEGFGLGGTRDNVVVIDFEGSTYLSRLRFADECVRHKMLDAVGDLSLAGMPILGKFIGKKTGHATNCKLLDALFSDPENYAISLADEVVAAGLPGVDLTLDNLETMN